MKIKFRAYDKKDKIMYFNVQRGTKFTDLSHYTFDEFLGNKKGMGDYHEWEVMQYTGLKDKNGVEIYEGDILKADRGYVGRFGFKKVNDWGYNIFEIKIENCCVFFRRGEEAIPMFERVGKKTKGINIAEVSEVIGNIYKDQKLLKGNYE